MGTGPFWKRRECRARAEAKLAAAKALIVEADQRWHGMAAFLERSGMDRNAELVGRLAHRADRRAKRERYIAEARAGRHSDGHLDVAGAKSILSRSPNPPREAAMVDDLINAAESDFVIDHILTDLWRGRLTRNDAIDSIMIELALSQREARAKVDDFLRG